MRLSRSGSRAASSDDSLIPMINVVFLLLVFFMVAGTIRPTEPLAVEPPESDRTGEPLAPRVLHVALDGSFALDGDVLSEAELGPALTAALARIDDGMAGRETGESAGDRGTANIAPAGAPPLALRADGGITFERLREVIAVLSAAGVPEVELLTTLVPAASD